MYEVGCIDGCTLRFCVVSVLADNAHDAVVRVFDKIGSNFENRVVFVKCPNGQTLHENDIWRE